MKIWPDSDSTASAVAYSQVQLVDASQQPVDLFIFNAKRGKTRVCWSSRSEAWLEEGRPRELSSVPLATWSLLTTSVKDYQRAMNELAARIMRRIILPIYIVWLLVVVVSSDSTSTESDLLNSLAWFGLCFMAVASIFVSRYYKQKHAVEVFHPSVQTVLQELGTPLSEAGFDVRLIVEGTSGKPVVSFLRFTALRDDDKDAQAMEAATNRV